MKEKLGKIAVTGFMVLVLGFILFQSMARGIYRPINKACNERTIIATVTDKEVKKYNKKDKYLIYTEDENGESQTFEITDSLLMWRWDSSDVYGKIERNKTYEFTVRGSRWQIMSFYPNIYDVKPIKQETLVTLMMKAIT